MSVETLHKQIRSAWRQALLDIQGIPSSWAWEGRGFSPVVGTPYVRESFAPISAFKRSFGPNGITEHILAGNLTLLYPPNKGTDPIETAAGKILAALQPGRSLTYGASSAIITKAERQRLYQQTDWLSCPVSITLMAHTQS